MTGRAGQAAPKLEKLMVDSIQRTSSVPVPDFVTAKGKQNPLPINSPAEQGKVDDKVKLANGETNEEAFEAYLNQSGISTLEKAQQSGEFDPAGDITANSVYTQPNDRDSILIIWPAATTRLGTSRRNQGAGRTALANLPTQQSVDRRRTLTGSPRGRRAVAGGRFRSAAGSSPHPRFSRPTWRRRRG